jgi:hypothetical protein
MRRLAFVTVVVGALSLVSSLAAAQSGGTRACDVWGDARTKGTILLLFTPVTSARVAMLASDGLEVTVTGKGAAEGGGCSAKDIPLSIAMRIPADAPPWVGDGIQHCASLAATAAGTGTRLTIYVAGKAESFPGKPLKEQFVWRPGASIRCEISKE